MGIIRPVSGQPMGPLRARPPPRWSDTVSNSQEPPETVETDREVVSCDGGGALGHPRVWLNMEGKGEIDCPYCDRLFVLRAGSAATPGH
jgi:uncharacterized Zn-finger protein